MKSRGIEFDDLIVKTYMENHSAYKTADKVGVTHKYVYRVLHDREISVPAWGDEKPHRRAIPLEDEPKVIEDYANGMTFKAMTEKYGCGDWALRYLVKRNGVKRRTHGGQLRRFTDDEIFEMKRLTDIGWAQAAIAATMKSSQVSISRALRSIGVGRAGKASGEQHGSWKGGKTKTQGGYTLVAISHDHKFSAMRGSTGYVLEHRLVMADSIGRSLGKYETVHHINGVVGDNRIENLQLRQGKHGKGVVMKCRCCGSCDIEVTEIAE